MRASVQPAFVYQLDPNDVIVSVSDDWLAFARENGASELDADAVVGKSRRFLRTGHENGPG